MPDENETTWMEVDEATVDACVDAGVEAIAAVARARGYRSGAKAAGLSLLVAGRLGRLFVKAALSFGMENAREVFGDELSGKTLTAQKAPASGHGPS